MRNTTIYIMICFLFMVCTACNQSNPTKSVTKKETVRIGYIPTTHAFPLFIEVEKQLDNKDFHIELIRFGSWPDLMDGLITGRIDGASVLITLAMKAKSQGIDLKAVALAHQDGNAVIVANDIQKVEDLKGNYFAIPHKFSTHNILRYKMLKNVGIAEDEVQTVELTPAEMPAALASGRIAGYVVAEPFGAVSVANGNGRVLYQSEELWKNALDCAIVFRTDFIQAKTDIMDEIIQRYVVAGELANHKNDALKTTVADYMKVSEEVLDISLQWISYKDLQIHKEAYDELVREIKEMNLFDQPPTYESFVNQTFMDKVK